MAIASKALTDEKWNAMQYPSPNVIDIAIQAESVYKHIRDLIKRHRSDVNIVELKRETGATREKESITNETKVVRINAAGRNSITVFGWMIVPFTACGILLFFLKEKDGGDLSLVGIGCLLLAFMLIWISKLLIYYTMTESGITKYIYPNIRLKHTRWEEVVEAGTTKYKGIYVSTIVQNRKIVEKSDSLSGKDGIVACSDFRNPKMAEHVRRFLPEEKWVKK